MNYSPEFLKLIPKTDLHVHLDGSLRLSTLIDLAEQYQVDLPSDSEEGLKKKVFKEGYADLKEYLTGFKYTVGVLQTAQALERVSYELARDCIQENVLYVEVRFAPQLHINPNLSMSEVLLAVNRGLKKAGKEHNDGLKPSEPEFRYGIIVCAMRMFTPAFSWYFKELSRVHAYSTEKDLFSLASLELAKAACKIRDQENIPVVGFDLAGQEDGYPAGDHREAYEYCHHRFMKKTVHAGEAYGAESVFQAITDLHADRIGHGYYLFDTGKIGEDIKSPEDYVRKLANFIADRRITLEVCLTSNLQTNPGLTDLKNHSMKHMLSHGQSITICTDNRLISNTDVTSELKLATEKFEVPPNKLKDIIIYGYKRSFLRGNYVEKRKYCRKVINRYEVLEKEFGISV